MSIFTPKKSKKPSFIDKILKRAPKENAIIEINNLLVENEDDLIKVNLGHIQEIADRYKIKLSKKFKPLRFELFRKYIHHCLEDQVIDENEVNTIQHLKELLYLTDAEVKHMLDFETKKIFDREVKVAVSDGKLTQDEKDKLEILKKNLLLTDETAKDILKSNSNKILKDFIDNAISDERLSDEEFEKMNEISQSLGIEPNLDAKTKQNLERYRLYWTIENGELPVYANPPINIQKSENLYFMGHVNWQEQRRVTKRINYGGPTARIKIAKGVYYRMGSIAAKSVSEDVWKVIDSGNLYLTNKRLIFMGSKGNKTIRLNKILDIIPYKNGVDIQKDAGKSPFLEFSTNVDIFSMMLVRLIDEL
jgi:uncharacterized tellurite resistance protein B-like protein